MTDGPPENPGIGPEVPNRPTRRRRTPAELDAIFGDVVPTQTSDDRDGPGIHGEVDPPQDVGVGQPHRHVGEAERARHRTGAASREAAARDAHVRRNARG